MQIDAWEQEQCSHFLVNGQNFMEYVSEQWELHKLEKEREKQERVRPQFVLCDYYFAIILTFD